MTTTDEVLVVDGCRVRLCFNTTHKKTKRYGSLSRHDDRHFLTDEKQS